MMPKEIIRFKNGDVKKDVAKCNPLRLAPASKYIEKYWWEIICDVFNYEKERE